MEGTSPKPAPSVPFAEIPQDVRERLVGAGATPEILEAPVYRALATQPDLLRGWVELSWSLGMRSGPRRRLRELVIVRMTLLQNARFEREAHERFARDADVTDAELADLADWRVSARFSAAERAALAFADAMHDGRVPDGTLAELERHYTPQERVELIVTCGFYVMVPRVNNALRVV